MPQPNNKTFSQIKTFFLALILLTYVTEVKTAEVVQIGKPLRDVTLQGLLVKSKKMSEYRGKPLIINVWASWCGPCREEMGSLERLSSRFGGKQFNVIGISTDDERSPALQMIIESKLSFNNYIDNNLTLEKMLGANTIPLTIFVDAKGFVVKKIRGSQVWDSPQSVKLISETFHVKLPQDTNKNNY
jgi:thiol-disulfide isomerase/thioredoxin